METTIDSTTLAPDLTRIQQAKHHDPFAVLGRHQLNGQIEVRVYIPNAVEVRIADGDRLMQRVLQSDFFEWHGEAESLPQYYRIAWRDNQHREHIAHDPYCFPAQITAFDLYLFGEGKLLAAYNVFGANLHEVDGITGYLFAVWAPNAERVSVVGDFNQWDGRRHPMRVRGNSGVWELFIPDLAINSLYKFEIRNRHSEQIFVKSDPYARYCQLRPNTASITIENNNYRWGDQSWMKQRKVHDWQHSPMSIYEVHLGSWQRGLEGEMLNYRELATRLVDYVKDLGFSHIELLPITEHPYDPSWGYQTTGYFAPSSRFGDPDDFKYFIDLCHQHNIGVILDWVPAHFPKDAHALAKFDGSALYEHEDPRLGEHLDWSTLIFNFGRNEVKNLLISSALYWIDEFHIDGLRVDAVASMLYLDYSRTDWIPNQHGGRENLEAIAFIRELNEAVHATPNGALMMAEESTSWPQVSRPVYAGGLGFDLKWNMGWMNDTLSYMQEDPVHRKYQHNMLTFSMLYAFTENFLLPFSHDEVTHGKQSMLNKMPGDEWQRFANLRLLYGYMFTHPGKKLLFMGCEFAQGTEWNSAHALDWYVLDYPLHQGLQNFVKDLNHLYHSSPALYYHEFDWNGFEWIDCQNADQSIVSFLRKANDEFLLVVVNFTPVIRHDYRIGVPHAGSYREVLNSDSISYGGGNVGNGDKLMQADNQSWMNQAHSLSITIPPLACIVLAIQ